MPDESGKRTTDERIDAIAMNVELISREVEHLATTTKANFELVLDSIKGLERISLAHSQLIDDHDERLEELEDEK